MDNMLQIVTVEGQRWDQVAQQAYGDTSLMNVIIAANPDVPVYDVLPGGIALNIPVLASVEVKTDIEKLPPWKR